MSYGTDDIKKLCRGCKNGSNRLGFEFGKPQVLTSIKAWDRGKNMQCRFFSF